MRRQINFLSNQEKQRDTKAQNHAMFCMKIFYQKGLNRLQYLVRGDSYGATGKDIIIEECNGKVSK